MAVIDSNGKAKFDPVIRSDKGNSLLSFIYATYIASKNPNNTDMNTKRLIALKLKDCFDIFRKGGAGSYGSGSQDIENQFFSQYTTGQEMGIWKNSELELSEMALKVAEKELLISDYIAIVFLNLFTYYDIGNGQPQKTYHHFLYEILKKIKIEGEDEGYIRKELILETLPDHISNPKSNEDKNIIFNYLIDSSLFYKINDKYFSLRENWKNKIDILMDLCNLEYKEASPELAIELARDKVRYCKYVATNSDRYLAKQHEDSLFDYNVEVELIEEDDIREDYDDSTISRNRILYGPPGTGKTYNSVIYAVDTILENNNLDKNNYSLYLREYRQLESNKQIAFTTFHQSYGYEEFIEGIRPVISNNAESSEKSDPEYKIVDGVFKSFCKNAMENKGKRFVFIIDEINRGNIAKIFGELITLIEESKRDGKPEAMSVILPYSGERFTVPDNVYIIGTMNTADRSIALLDTALRRRFTFIEKMPDLEVVKDIVIKSIDESSDKKVEIHKLLSKINRRIEILFDREHTIGHAFFVELQEDGATFEKLAVIFKEKIFSLLQEYFHANYKLIMMVLGIPTDNNDTAKFISINEVSDTDIEFDFDNKLPTVLYQINDEAFKDIDNYIAIYED